MDNWQLWFPAIWRNWPDDVTGSRCIADPPFVRLHHSGDAGLLGSATAAHTTVVLHNPGGQNTKEDKDKHAGGICTDARSHACFYAMNFKGAPCWETGFMWWEDLTELNLSVVLLFTHTAVILSSRKVTKAMPSLFIEMRFFSALNSSVRFSSNSL